MRYGCIIALFVVLLPLKLRAQDYQFSQFYAIPLIYNPAFAGANLKSRSILAFRNQWAGLTGWKGWAASADTWLKNANSGVGICLSQNFLAQTGYTQGTGMLQYSYRARWRKDVRMCFGMGLGYSYFRWSPAYGLMGDQLAKDPVLPQSADPVANINAAAGVFDLQLGFLFYSRNWWVSLAGLHPHSPTYFILKENTLESRVNLSAGYRLILEKRADYKNQETPVSVTAAMLIRNQSNANQLDLGIYYHYPPFVSGIWYRGIPVPTGKLDVINHDATTLLAGIKQNNLTMGYSYDIPLNGIVPVYLGSHEITLTYEFKTKGLNLRGRNPKSLPCPVF